MALRFGDGTNDLDSGILFADQNNTLSGVTGSGALTSQQASSAGTASIVGQASTGSLVSSSASTTGTATREIIDLGSTIELESSDASVGVTVSGVAGTGTASSGQSSVSGTAQREVTGTGSLSSAAVAAIGAGFVTDNTTKLGSGDLQAEDASTAAVTHRSLSGSGALVSQAASTASESPEFITGHGKLVAQRFVEVLLDGIVTEPQINTYAEASPPNNYLVCDRTGFRVTRHEGLKKEWTGAMVREESWEPRHPLDFIRSRTEIPKGSPRPEQQDRFIDDEYPDGVTLDDLDGTNS